MKIQPWMMLIIAITTLWVCVYLADLICQGGKLTAQTIRKWLKSWWKRNIIDNFPHPNICFDCNKHDKEGCGDCPVLLKIAMQRRD